MSLGAVATEVTMFMEDMQPYQYGVPVALADVFAIGWLSAEQAYPKGELNPAVIRMIEKLLSTHRVNQMRGYHTCELCGRSPIGWTTASGKEVLLGSAEIWIPSLDQKRMYAAPDLIYHYVVDHEYLPPREFQEAVLAAPELSSWSAERESRRLLESAFK